MKLRPALVLALLPGPYQDILLCGVSTQLHLVQSNWDELMQPADADFVGAGLHQASAIRLSYLYATEAIGIVGDHLRP